LRADRRHVAKIEQRPQPERGMVGSWPCGTELCTPYLIVLPKAPPHVPNHCFLSNGFMVSALGLIEEGDIRIDLLLTDVVLPGMNGRQMAEQAKNRRPDLKMLFTTGYSRNAIVHQGRLDPGVAMIQKPITQDGLAARIRDLLDARLRES